MKIKEYIKTFHLYKKGAKINSVKLKEQFEKEFDQLISNNKADENLNEFEACVTKIIQKIDGINLRAQTEIHEGFIRFFYATVVLDRKKQYFPKKVKEDEQRYESHKKAFENANKQ